MIALDDGAIHFTNQIDAFVRVRVVTHHVAQANEMRAFVFAPICKHGLERLKIGVNVTENGEAHRVGLAAEDRHISMQLTRRTTGEFNSLCRGFVAVVEYEVFPRGISSV